jgi:cyclophilin family peptidyl-prolyl cis-trans isomerase
MGRELLFRGVPERAILRERCSLSTRENARFAYEVLARRDRCIEPVALVTCDWHMPRASALFRRAGFVVEPVPAVQGGAPWRKRLWRRGREWALSWLVWLVSLAVIALVACSRSAPDPRRASAIDAGATASPPHDFAVLALAEDLRRARDVPQDARGDHDPAVRRRAARAFARILDGDDGPLLRALGDDDPEVVAWAAYGLGASCKGREEAAHAHVSALAARLASLDHAQANDRLAAAAATAALDPVAVLLRAVGRCGGEDAEQTLRVWLGRADAASEAAAYALGDASSRRGVLSPDSAAALLEAAQRSPPLDAALYAFGRSDLNAGPELRARMLAAARAALGRPGPPRIFAVRALGRSGNADAAPDLARVVASGAFTPAERAEAAHALGRLRKAGQSALAEALAALVPEGRVQRAFEGDGFGVLLATLRALADGWTKTAESELWAIARMEPGDAATAAILRRVSALRCAAAARLARGAWDADVLRGCDVGDGEAAESARLSALERAPLTRARRGAWVELAHSKHLRVREAALEAAERHPELGDAALAELADAISSSDPGVVATAADVVRAHPERVRVLAASERRAALDPRSPPPPVEPAHELDGRIARALRTAIARPWKEDLVETRVALVDAALAAGLDEGLPFAQAACSDPNATVRARAARALAAAGQKDATCLASEKGVQPAPEIGHELARPLRVSLETDAGTLSLTFDPALAPIAATRFVSLARSGFYNGTVIHRVVAGFVVQLGDPEADGYGGSGRLIRCETSPVPFAALDVGVALAGRDTGSSQIFVTLARQPHLDGEYAWVGRAEGDWDAVAEGDVVREAHVGEE